MVLSGRVKIDFPFSVLNFVLFSPPACELAAWLHFGSYPAWPMPLWMGLALSVSWRSHLVMLNWAESESVSSGSPLESLTADVYGRAGCPRWSPAGW